MHLVALANTVHEAAGKGTEKPDHQSSLHTSDTSASRRAKYGTSDRLIFGMLDLSQECTNCKEGNGGQAFPEAFDQQKSARRIPGKTPVRD